MVRKVLEKMPDKVLKQIQAYKHDYKKYEGDYRLRDTTRACASAYVRGLKDAGLIDNRERQALFTYITV